jgi:hypothetical protein
VGILRLENQSTMKLIIAIKASKVLSLKNDPTYAWGKLGNSFDSKYAQIFQGREARFITEPLNIEFFTGGDERYWTDQRMFQTIECMLVGRFDGKKKLARSDLDFCCAEYRYDPMVVTMWGNSHIVRRD